MISKTDKYMMVCNYIFSSVTFIPYICLIFWRTLTCHPVLVNGKYFKLWETPAINLPEVTLHQTLACSLMAPTESLACKAC